MTDYTDTFRDFRATTRSAFILLREMAPPYAPEAFHELLDSLDHAMEQMTNCIEVTMEETVAQMRSAVDRRVATIIEETRTKSKDERGHLRLVKDVFDGEGVA